MGLDATVMCNCFRDGKTKPPPFPSEWLEVDNEGYINLKKEHNSGENWAKHYEWGQSCCGHKGMDFARERISNWTGYRQFQEALGEVGWQHFRVLKEQLPNANGGLTPSAASAKAIEELDFFASAGEIGVKTFLIDIASGKGLYEYVAAYGGVFILSRSYEVNAGLSEFEFVAVDATSGEDLFRATRFRQFHKSGKKVDGHCDGIAWENLDTGDVYDSGIAIRGQQIPWEDGSWEKPNGQCRFEYPSEFQVEQRPRLVSDFDDIVKALRTVFEASVETGNPVRWC
ncbi:hypothetical protein AB1L30_10940 [Bremerella sp. JC817]|uniref:hypothetical protein n=1 Tax=Bremerella sp. JC817 TaxID=3231756 RepID=UPI00345975B1